MAHRDTPPPIPLDAQLCFALYGASMAISRAYKPTLDRLGITYPQFLVLQSIEEADGRSITRIAERLEALADALEPEVSGPIG